MKILALISNFALLGFVCYCLFKSGIPKSNEDIVAFSVMTLTPILNLVALFFSGIGENWLSLYLKRKALEEQRRIDKLAQKDEHRLN